VIAGIAAALPGALGIILLLSFVAILGLAIEAIWEREQ